MRHNGLRIASLGSTRLPSIRIDSIASGMPWPRIRSEPYRAVRPNDQTTDDRNDDDDKAAQHVRCW